MATTSTLRPISQEARDEYDKCSEQLRGLLNLINCGSQDPGGSLHDATIPAACWLAADLLDKLDSLFNGGLAE